MMIDDNDKIRKLLHDLRGPLDVIKGFLRSLEKIEITEEHKEYLEAALKSAEKMGSIIENQVRDNSLNAL